MMRTKISVLMSILVFASSLGLATASPAGAAGLSASVTGIAEVELPQSDSDDTWTTCTEAQEYVYVNGKKWSPAFADMRNGVAGALDIVYGQLVDLEDLVEARVALLAASAQSPGPQGMAAAQAAADAYATANDAKLADAYVALFGVMSAAIGSVEATARLGDEILSHMVLGTSFSGAATGVLTELDDLQALTGAFDCKSYRECIDIEGQDAAIMKVAYLDYARPLEGRVEAMLADSELNNDILQATAFSSGTTPARENIFDVLSEETHFATQRNIELQLQVSNSSGGESTHHLIRDSFTAIENFATRVSGAIEVLSQAFHYHPAGTIRTKDDGTIVRERVTFKEAPSCLDDVTAPSHPATYCASGFDVWRFWAADASATPTVQRSRVNVDLGDPTTARFPTPTGIKELTYVQAPSGSCNAPNGADWLFTEHVEQAPRLGQGMEFTAAPEADCAWEYYGPVGTTPVLEDHYRRCTTQLGTNSTTPVQLPTGPDCSTSAVASAIANRDMIAELLDENEENPEKFYAFYTDLAAVVGPRSAANHLGLSVVTAITPTFTGAEYLAGWRAALNGNCTSILDFGDFDNDDVDERPFLATCIAPTAYAYQISPTGNFLDNPANDMGTVQYDGAIVEDLADPIEAATYVTEYFGDGTTYPLGSNEINATGTTPAETAARTAAWESVLPTFRNLVAADVSSRLASSPDATPAVVNPNGKAFIWGRMVDAPSTLTNLTTAGRKVAQSAMCYTANVDPFAEKVDCTLEKNWDEAECACDGDETRSLVSLGECDLDCADGEVEDGAFCVEDDDDGDDESDADSGTPTEGSSGGWGTLYRSGDEDDDADPENPVPVPAHPEVGGYQGKDLSLEVRVVGPVLDDPCVGGELCDDLFDEANKVTVDLQVRIKNEGDALSVVPNKENTDCTAALFSAYQGLDSASRVTTITVVPNPGSEAWYNDPGSMCNANINRVYFKLIPEQPGRAVCISTVSPAEAATSGGTVGDCDAWGSIPPIPAHWVFDREVNFGAAARPDTKDACRSANWDLYGSQCVYRGSIACSNVTTGVTPTDVEDAFSFSRINSQAGTENFSEAGPYDAERSPGATEGPDTIQLMTGGTRHGYEVAAAFHTYVDVYQGSVRDSEDVLGTLGATFDMGNSNDIAGQLANHLKATCTDGADIAFTEVDFVSGGVSSSDKDLGLGSFTTGQVSPYSK